MMTKASSYEANGKLSLCSTVFNAKVPFLDNAASRSAVSSTDQ